MFANLAVIGALSHIRTNFEVVRAEPVERTEVEDWRETETGRVAGLLCEVVSRVSRRSHDQILRPLAPHREYSAISTAGMLLVITALSMFSFRRVRPRIAMLHNRETLFHNGHALEEGFLVFLEVSVIRGGKTFRQGEEGEEGAYRPRGLPPYQFQGVGVLLVGHQARARAEAVREDQETIFLGGEEDQVFRELGSDGS